MSVTPSPGQLLDDLVDGLSSPRERTTVGARTVPVPTSIEETGISGNLLRDLALKVLFLNGDQSLDDLAGHLRLDVGIVQDVTQRLRRERLCEMKGSIRGESEVIATTPQGKERAVGLLSASEYAGAAPVALQDYTKQIRAQSIRDVDLHHDDLLRAFASLVLSRNVLDQLGPALVSGGPILLHGPTGTGKSSIAQTLPLIYQDPVWVPYAVEVEGKIVTVYDSGLHEKIDEPMRRESDGRWVLCRRPRVLAGAELTSEMLELQSDPLEKFYNAPLQVKANNGLVVIDDLGRQQVTPQQLLNRWIAPLDRGVDALALAGGKTFPMPVDFILIFATTLKPAELGDEAVLRRIQAKIATDMATPDQFHEIFRRVCREFKVRYESAVVDDLIRLLTTELNEPLRPCYPREIIQQIYASARYQDRQPQVDPTIVREACRRRFRVQP